MKMGSPGFNFPRSEDPTEYWCLSIVLEDLHGPRGNATNVKLLEIWNLGALRATFDRANTN